MNELEDKIKDIEVEHASQQLDAHQEIERLEIENEELIKENAMWKVTVEKLRGEVMEWSDRAKGYLEEMAELKREREAEREMAVMKKIQQVASPPSETSDTEHEGVGMGMGVDGGRRDRMSPPPPSPPSQVIRASPVPEVALLSPRRPLRNKSRGAARLSACTARVSSPIPTTPAKPATGCMKATSGACSCVTRSRATSPEPELQLSPSPSSSAPPFSSSYNPPEVTIHSLSKRPTSPSTNPPDKRTRLNATLPSSTSIDELETDFTILYASGEFTSVSTPSPSPSMMADPCGFCSDGTPCVCAEMAMLEEQRGRGKELGSRDVEMAFGIDAKLPPLQLYEIDEPFGAGMRGIGMGGVGVMHPPNGAKAVMIDTAARGTGCGATGGPGSCGLCQRDPLAMLFCQSVASRCANALSTPRPTSSTTHTPSSDCGGGSTPKSGGVCCKAIKSEPCDTLSNTNLDKLPLMLPPSNSIYIPCSAAYQTLARHRAFEKASMDDFPGLVRPLVIGGEGGQGGCPKVEVGSLRDVLKMLDRRFGKGVA